jgi:GT2 family glycosyltransferase
VYDSSEHNTKFTRSFNECLALGLDSGDEYIGVWNNDIMINQEQIDKLMGTIAGKIGIFHLACNSPHHKVMTPVGSEPLRQVPWVEFVAPVFHREVVEKVGMLDEDMSYGWGVELDYCYRAKMQGYDTMLVQNDSMKHFGHKSQGNHNDYIAKASPEMHQVLEKKYGKDWQKKLNYPQW